MTKEVMSWILDLSTGKRSLACNGYVLSHLGALYWVGGKFVIGKKSVDRLRKQRFWPNEQPDGKGS